MGSNTWDSVKFFGIAFAGVLAMAAIIFLPIRAFQHNLDTRDCAGFSQASGYATKFVDYTFFSWDCFIQTDSGNWMPLSVVREVHSSN